MRTPFWVNIAYPINTHVNNQVGKLVGMEMTIRETARHLNVSVNTVRRRLHAGVLTGTKVGTQWVLTINGPGGGVAPPEPGEDNSRQSEVTWLREQLEARTREIAELHQLLAAHSLNAGQRKNTGQDKTIGQDVPWWAFWRWMWP